MKLGGAMKLLMAGGADAASPPSVVGWDAVDVDANGINFASPLNGSARAAGDILVMFWTGTNFSNTVPSAPSGWTLVASDRTGSNNPVAIYAKVASGSETTFNFGAAAGYRFMALIIRGGSSWTAGACVGDSSSGTTKTPATVTGVGASDLRLQMVTANLGTSLSKTGASWSDAVTPQVGSFHGGTTMGVGACYSVGSGVSPSFSWTAGSGLFWGTGQLVIRP